MNSEEPLTLPPMERQTSPFVIPDMQRQVSPGQMKALPMADDDPYPDNYFEKRGVELPSHLATKKQRWIALLIVVISSAFASGPISSWPTLEPLLIEEGVFAGPHQEVLLTAVYSLAVGIAMVGQTFAGIVYDAIGPRATAAGSAFVIVLCLAGMAIGIQFQKLNFLLWFCYPAAVTIGYCNNMGGYAWLYLLPDSQNTVSSLTGAIQILSDSFVLIAVLLHHVFGLPLPVYFTLCAVLSFLAAVICLLLIPDYTTSRKVAFAVTNPEADIEKSSYGATESCTQLAPESFLDVVKRSLGALRDCLVCFVWYCPGASFLYLIGYGCASYMFGVYPQFVMYPFYQALLGTAEAASLVDIFGGLYAVFGAFFLIMFGRFVDSVGFEKSLLLMNIPVVMNFVFFCCPNFDCQVLGQVLLSLQSNVWYVLVPRWCLSYAPPELYGSAFGISGGVLGIFQMIGTPFGTMLSSFIDKEVTTNSGPALPYLTTMGIWCVLTVFFSLLYIWFMRYYPMPAPGETTMENVTNFFKAAKKEETLAFAKKEFPFYAKEKAPAAPHDIRQPTQKSSTPTCSPCECLNLGSRDRGQSTSNKC